MPALPIGTYKLTGQAPGFKTFIQTGNTLQVEQNARVDVSLRLRSLNQTAQVSSAALSVNTYSTTVGEIVDNRRFRSIPLNGRNVLGLVQLLPGVGEFSPRTTVTFNRSGPSLTVSGSRESQNNVELDGATIVSGMIAEYFNTAAFAAPDLGQYGNAGRNLITGPRFMQTDLAVEKQFKIPKENWGGFEFRAEMFNLFNNTNFYTPNGTFGSPSFGRITGAHDARIIQFALRYDF